MVALKIVSVLAGIYLICFTILSALRTFVVPRGLPDPIARFVFQNLRRIFNIRLRYAKSYIVKDKVMAFYAPSALVLLPIIWLTLVTIGFASIYWGLGSRSWFDAYKLSGSAITTLGFSSTDSILENAIVFTEATIGLILVAILISYLPTMYAAWSEREMAVTKLDVRAGTPASAIVLLQRSYRIGSLDDMTAFWYEWENWFTSVEETHTSLPALSLYRSTVPEYNWVIAAGTVLDSAALANAAIDLPHDPQADLCLRAGYLMLRRIASFFGIKYDEFPSIEDPISISKKEFNEALDDLAAAGVPIKPDREKAWLDFKGWRINYDTVLLSMCNIVMAPYAPWSSDRSHLHRQSTRTPIFFRSE